MSPSLTQAESSDAFAAVAWSKHKKWAGRQNVFLNVSLKVLADVCNRGFWEVLSGCGATRGLHFKMLIILYIEMQSD